MTKSLSKIQIKGLQFYAYHGVMTEEKQIGGRFEIDLEYYYDATKAIIADDLNYAVNYKDILFDIAEFMNGDTYNLIETIAYELLSNLMVKFNNVMKMTIKVRKFNIPFKGTLNYVETEQSFERE